MHCSIVTNDYQQDSRVLYPFIHNKSFYQLLYISPKSFIVFKIINLNIFSIKLCFTDQNSKPTEVKDRISITLVIN